uniref:Senescence domain-containing protein n=1 Tax=Arundo donax TaxID=35708 RepID=A0A0A9GX74_ARUDO
MLPGDADAEVSPEMLMRIKRYGDKAAAATKEGLDAAGHAGMAVWAVFKIRQAWNPKSAIRPMALAKSTVKGMFNSRAKSRL